MFQMNFQAKCVLSLTLMILFAAPVSADMTYSFVNITANSLASAAIGEAQLAVKVSDYASGQALFTFMNSGPEASSICDIYFDDGTLLGIASILDDHGETNPQVLFSQYAKPKDLPGGNNMSPPFVTHEGFSADSDSPVQPMGVNPGESVGILFNLIDGQGYNEVIGALADGALRIGIHVQGFDNGQSEGFVNNGPVVPAPGAALLGLSGFAMVGWIRSRFNSKSE